ncbi:MAG: putative lipid II flippase FtsW [Bacillota bacterium]|nr:putative lipid II flippase FtsW [Bacillota bacterium]
MFRKRKNRTEQNKREEALQIGLAKPRMDFSILIVTMILVCFGVLMVFSASFYSAQQRYNDPYYFFRKQIIGAGIGLVLMLLFSWIDYRKLRKFSYIGVVVSVVLLILVLIPGIGTSMHGSSRWFYISGVSIQPSEIAKFAFIIFAATFMAMHHERMKGFFRGIVPILIILAAMLIPILFQPNFSTVIAMSLLCVAMLFIGGAKKWQIGLIGIGGVGGGFALLFSATYRVKRLLAFIDPWASPAEEGYQLIQSLYSLGSGGIFGKGLGNSQQKYLFLPYGESDFIFSIIGEELGFIGALALMLLFGFLIWRCIRVAYKSPDKFGCYMAAGIASIIAVQVAMHIGVVTGSIPPTGLPLPFISAGSSSLVIFMASMGIMLNISKQIMRI